MDPNTNGLTRISRTATQRSLGPNTYHHRHQEKYPPDRAEKLKHTWENGNHMWLGAQDGYKPIQIKAIRYKNPSRCVVNLPLAWYHRGKTMSAKWSSRQPATSRNIKQLVGSGWSTLVNQKKNHHHESSSTLNDGSSAIKHRHSISIMHHNHIIGNA